jgi:type VI secretion system secreted protein VgrG
MVSVTADEEAGFGVGNQQLTCDKAKVNVSGAAINSSAVGTHEIAGALVKIN